MAEHLENASLETAQAALEAEEYDRAIAHLGQVLSEEVDPICISQAQQALIVAYTKSDRLQEAIDLCSWLAADAKNTWAPKTLADLRERHESARLQAIAEGDTVASSVSEPQTRLPSVTDADRYEGGRRWRHAERATDWKPLKQMVRWRFWFLQFGSLVVAFLILRACGLGLQRAVLSLLSYTPADLHWESSLAISIASGLLLLVLLAIAPRWLGWIQRRYYGATALELTALAARLPETAKLLQRYCRQQQLPRPSLTCLPLEHPVAMAYGSLLPGSARIVLSEGFLERLQDDEASGAIATLLGQIHRRDCIVMGALVGLLQFPFLGYLQLSRWGDRCPPGLRHVCAIAAAGCYGVYWLWRVPALWLSRRRLYYSDRFAAELTGDPNALCRALLKIALGTAAAIAAQQATHPCLESFELLLPVSPRQSISIGSIPPYTPFESVLAWECTNPYRHWLKVFDSHTLLGDRLFLLGRYAAFWQLPAELDLPKVAPPPKSFGAYLTKLRRSYRALPILHSGVLSGSFLGIVLWAIFWLLSVLSNWLGVGVLDWLRSSDTIVLACILFAFSLCAIVWINGYFPDISRSTRPSRLPDLLAKTRSTPPNGRGVRLKGKLLGRGGIGNWLARDLILQTDDGAIELNFASRFGPLGYVFARRRPSDYRGQTVTIYGWFRRGATAWIDVDRLVPPRGTSHRSGYPWWVTGLALTSAFSGAALIIFR